MKVIVTGNIRAAREDLLHRGSPVVSKWSDARMMGVVDGVETIIVSIDNPNRIRGLRLTDWDIHPTAQGHRRYGEVIELLKTRVHKMEPET